MRYLRGVGRAACERYDSIHSRGSSRRCAHAQDVRTCPRESTAASDERKSAPFEAKPSGVLKQRALGLFWRLAHGQRSPDERLIGLDEENSRARAASRGYATVGRYVLALGEHNRTRELSAIAAALRVTGP